MRTPYKANDMDQDMIRERKASGTRYERVY